jgi:hypothetical protein
VFVVLVPPPWIDKQGTAMNATTSAAGRAATPAGNGGETVTPSLRRQRMQAIVQDTYGAVDVWRVEEIARPEIAGNEVLVKVHAAGLDRALGTSWPACSPQVIDKNYPLRRAPGAMCYLGAGHAQGKLVVTVTGAG